MKFSQKLLLPICSAMLMAGGTASANTLITSTGFETVDSFNAETAGFTGGVNTETPDGSVWSSGVVNSKYNAIWAADNHTAGGSQSAIIGNEGQHLVVDPTGNAGVGTLRFMYSSYTAGSDATIEIQWTSDPMNGNEHWTTAETITVTGLDNQWHLLNADIQQPGDIKLRWLVKGTGGVSIDDVEITEFVDPVIARSSFEPREGFQPVPYQTGVIDVTSSVDNAVWKSGVAGNDANGIWTNDKMTGSQSAVIGHTGQYLQVDPAGSAGVNTVSFYHSGYSGDTDIDVSLQWTTDDVNGTESWTQAGAFSVSGVTDWSNTSIAVNQPGDVKIRWLVSGTKGISIDDVTVNRFVPTPVKVAAVGDSITYGYGFEDRSSSYPAQLQELLGDQYQVGNFGRSGARVSTVSSNPYLNSPEYHNALGFGADIIFIALGINDCSPGQWDDNKPVFGKDYKTLIDNLRASDNDPEIYIGSLMPVVHPYGKYLEIHEQLPECRQYVEQVAKDNNLPFIDLYSPLNPEESIFASDGLHPDATGAGMIADTVFKAITQEYGGLQLPWVFGDNMVLQRNKPIDVFGAANPEEVVTVELDGAEAGATADENGRWEVSLPAKPASGPFQLTVSSSSGRSIQYDNIMVGEVWVAAGQSNMAWEMRQDRDWNKEQDSTNDYPNIRILNRVGNPYPNNVVFNSGELNRLTVDNYYSGSWENGSKTSVAPVSAVAYYFAREVHKKTGMAVGIIENAIGGTSMEAYMPRTALNTPELNLVMKDWINADIAPEWHRGRAEKNLQGWLESDRSTPMPHHPYEPTFLYDAEVADLMDFNFRGVLWYQGETNATDGSNQIAWDNDYNQKMFEGLIKSWREEAGDADLPFYYVQLPSLNRNWAPFRDMQRKVLTESGLENLGMAVTLDLGHKTDVHPTNKIEVGKRLSLWARSTLYGESSLTYSGPIFNGNFIDNGATLEIGFDHVANGLTTNSCGPLVGFEVAGSDGIWKAATATFSKDKVVVASDEVADPQAVRYAWAGNPSFNLYNYSGDFNGDDYQLLPASPFQAGNLNFN